MKAELGSNLGSELHSELDTKLEPDIHRSDLGVLIPETSERGKPGPILLSAPASGLAIH